VQIGFPDSGSFDLIWVDWSEIVAILLFSHYD
jgi:hypothetical protein